MSEIVTVLGMHRSGTSLCAHVLHAMGVNMADTPGASPDNAKGHWERARINDLNDEVLALFGRGWAQASHVLALPEHWASDPRVLAVQERLVAYVGSLAGGAFGFKDPRTARLMKMWRGVFDALGARPRFVFCVREPAQVVRSLQARDRMMEAQGEYRWLIYNAAAITGVAGDPVCIVSYEDWFDQPARTAERLATFVGCEAPEELELRALIDQGLRHDSAQESAQSLASRLYGLIRAGAAENVFSADVRTLAADIEAFARAVQPLLVEGEISRASVARQNRVIADLTDALRQARGYRFHLVLRAPGCKSLKERTLC
jgi:hypothetical protein